MIGTSCQIEIHFPFKTAEFLFKYTLLYSQIYGRFLIFFTKHDYSVSVSFIKEKQRYKWLQTAKRISILLLVSGLFYVGQISYFISQSSCKLDFPCYYTQIFVPINKIENTIECNKFQISACQLRINFRNLSGFFLK